MTKRHSGIFLSAASDIPVQSPVSHSNNASSSVGARPRRSADLFRRLTCAVHRRAVHGAHGPESGEALGHVTRLLAALVRQVESWRSTRHDLARRGRRAVTNEAHIRVWRRFATCGHSCQPNPLPLRENHRSVPDEQPLWLLEWEVTHCRRCPRLVAWREGITLDPPRRIAAKGIGHVPSLRSAMTVGVSSSSVSRRRRTVATAPAGCSPVTAPETSCSRRFTAPALRINRQARRLMTDSCSVTALSPRRCAAVHPTIDRPPMSATAAFPISNGCCPFSVKSASSSASARSPTTQLGGRSSPKDAHRGRNSPTGSRCPSTAATGDLTVVCSYHPSQRNVFTGLLTAGMFDDVLRLATARLR